MLFRSYYQVIEVEVSGFEHSKTGMISGEAMNNLSSYIGFRGIEDLGGGLKAGFRLEQLVNMENGATASPNGFVGRGFEAYGRAANLWLEGGAGRIPRRQQLSRQASGCHGCLIRATFRLVVKQAGRHTFAHVTQLYIWW